MIRIEGKLVVLLALLVGSIVLLYHDVIASLVHDWVVDENYSHGFLIVPISLFFIWERRSRLLSTQCRPNNLGLILVLLSLGLLLAGILGSELFLTRISILGTIAGTVLFLRGWNYLKILMFPIVFLLLMIPIPTIIFNQIAFPLQLLASQFAELALAVLHIPVLREGNVIRLANTSLEVADACSGIRSLISLLTLGIVYGYFMDRRLWYRILLALATLPVAVLTNGFRVAGTGAAAQYYGPDAAQGFFHAFSGWLAFLAAFALLFALDRALKLLLHTRAAPARQ